jgi:hypothetical protein
METHDEAGVDLTVIRWFMSLSIPERFDVLEDSIDFAAEVCERNGVEPWDIGPDGVSMNIEGIKVPRLVSGHVRHVGI